MGGCAGDNLSLHLRTHRRRFVCAGRSLLWVAVLGTIFLYIYALIGFGFFRSVFDPQDELYCASLIQCTVTIIRYGLMGDIDEVTSQRQSVYSQCM